MAKNKVQFQKGYSLFEFMQDYGMLAAPRNSTKTRCGPGVTRRALSVASAATERIAG